MQQHKGRKGEGKEGVEAIEEERESEGQRKGDRWADSRQLLGGKDSLVFLDQWYHERTTLGRRARWVRVGPDRPWPSLTAG